jgi:hypothetical protein
MHTQAQHAIAEITRMGEDFKMIRSALNLIAPQVSTFSM